MRHKVFTSKILINLASYSAEESRDRRKNLGRRLTEALKLVLLIGMPFYLAVLFDLLSYGFYFLMIFFVDRLNIISITCFIVEVKLVKLK